MSVAVPTLPALSVLLMLALRVLSLSANRSAPGTLMLKLSAPAVPTTVPV